MAGLLLATGAAAQTLRDSEPIDQLDIEPRDELLELTWADAEDRLRGSLSPAVPQEGQPFRVSVQLGSFEGAPFEGPITFTLREPGTHQAQTVTVKRGEHHWEATFTPENDGPHLLDVSFRTTRYKVLHGAIQVVESARVPRVLGWAVLGLGALVLLGYGVRNLLRGERPEERTPTASAAEPVPPGPTPSAPAPETPPETPVAATPAGPAAEAPSTTEPPVADTSPAPGVELPPPVSTASTPEEQAAPGADPSPSPAALPENKPPGEQ